MSARVFNPFSMTEMRLLAARCPVVPDAEARARVCRNLYGPVNHEETRAFVARELAVAQERAAERWGFDFRKGVPRKNGPGSERYIWERVKANTVPAAYSLRRMQILGKIPTACPTALDTGRATVPVAACPKAPSEAAVVTPSVPNTRTPSPAPAPSAPLRKQSQITDFLQCRKRSLTSSKTVEEASASVKRARTTA